MKIAAALKDRILATYGDAVLAVFVTSSTARGLDLPFSDLELTAVVRDGTDIESKSYYHHGILIEIEYPEDARLLKNARRVTSDWPVVAGGYRDILVLFERDGWTRRLQEALDERDAADFTRALSHAVTTMLEERDKVRNASLERDSFTLRALAADVAHWATNVVLFLNRRPMVTTRWFYRQAFECPEQPVEFRQMVEVLRGIAPASNDEIVETAERLCAAVAELAARRGVMVERDDLIV